MQTIEQELDAVSPEATEESDNHLTPEEADVIFQRAEEEIKSLLRKMRRDAFVQNTLEAFCWLCIVASMVGMVYQLISYPHTLVIIYTKAIPASATATLDLKTRTFAPVTLTRSATTQTTGAGHQAATSATGQLTFYNGSYVSQIINAGTVYTGRSGVQVALLQSVTIPAASPPQFGEATIPAQAVHVGAAGNIAAYDITLALSNFLTVKNLSAFTGGRGARTFKAVAAKDLTTLTSTLNETVAQGFTTAFPLQPNEVALPTHCTTKTTPTHQAGEEAQTVTLTMAKTCSAVAYNGQQLNHLATAAFMKTRPGRNYHIVGSVQTTLQSVTPLSVTISGKWVFTFTTDYQQYLAENIAGKTPAQARKLLLHTGVISYASIPSTLPPDAMYINFLVLAG